MSESEFWLQLRFRINCYAPVGPEQEQLGYCDWFEAKHVRLGYSPSISGRVGFVNGSDATSWRFVLLLPYAYRDAANIKWASLLPSDTSDDWLEFDRVQQLLTIAPGE